MALLWERTSGGRRYQVRTAGRSIRLYTNGVLHSQYHPDHVFGGGVWDLLSLPAVWTRSTRLAGVLLLGLGGGAVVRQLRDLVEWDRFVAVERNPVHVDISRRFFGLDDVPLEIIQGDAGQWMERYAGGCFDLIIDDLFSDVHNEATRAVAFSRDWYAALYEALSEEGTLVVNFEDGRELGRRLNQIRKVRRDFKRVYKLTLPAYGNAVAVLLRRDASPADLEEGLRAIKPKRKRARLRYHLQRVEL